MIRGSDGVAGFFEDLPVLMFVLLGVSAMVLSGAWVAQENRARENERELGDAAREICRGILEKVEFDWGSSPRWSSLQSMDIRSTADRCSKGHSFSASIVCLHPETVTLVTATLGEFSEACETGFSCATFNGLDARGLVTILEVRAVAW